MTKVNRTTLFCTALLAAGLIQSRAQTTANWTGGASTTAWNDANNWDLLTVPGVGTNATISGGVTVDYNTPMTAENFAGVNSTAILSVNAAGFNIDAMGLAAYTGGAASLLNITASGVFSAQNSGAISLTTGSEISVNGGVLAITNSTGNISFGANGNNAGAGFTNNAGHVTFSQPFQSRGRFSRFVMNGGTLDLLGGGGIFESSNDQERQFLINGGTANLGDFTVGRTLNTVGTAGVVISNGVVNATSFRVGTGIAASGSTIFGGVFTNTGAFIISDRPNAATSGQRRVFFYVRGGSVYSTTPEGIIVGNQSNASAAAASIMGGFLDINAGLLEAEGITLVKDNTLSNVHGTLTLAGTGQVYLGSVGLVGNVGVSGTTYTVNLNGGTLGARSDYTIAADGTLGGILTVKAADQANVAHNITHNRIWSGTGSIIKTGAGTLTLNGVNSYTGPTTINEGTLALGGAIASSTISVASGATFDVSAAGGYTLGSSKILQGGGTVAGSFIAASGATLKPGGDSTVGALSFTGGLAEGGGVINSFEFSAITNDVINVVGNIDLNGGGTNTIVVTALGAAIPAGTYTLFTYTGSVVNGDMTNLRLSGINGTLVNNTSAKTISLVTSGLRAPTSVFWVGPGNWDVLNSVNWNDGTSASYFVQNDIVRFDANGAANPVIGLNTLVSPSSVTVDAVTDYTITGSGNISGAATLTKTNAGKFSLLTTNSYTGGTTIGQGILEISSLALAGTGSSIGAASSSTNNLVFAGGNLRYVGDNATTDRGASLNAASATIDITNNATTVIDNGLLAGSGALIKAGPGGLTLGAANTYAGGTVVSNGILQLNVAGAAGSGGITNVGTTVLRVGGAFTVANAMDFNGTSTIDLANVGGDSAFDGAWSGSGTVNVINQQNSSRTFTVGGNGNGGGSWNNFSGTLNMGTSAGSLRFNDGGGNFNFGSSNATIDLGTSTAVLLARNGAVTMEVGELRGDIGTKLSGRASGNSGTLTWSIGGKNTSAAFNGSIVDGVNATAIIKVGTGTWTLGGAASTYTGSTTINDGTLQVDGSIGSSSVTVVSGRLSGNGTIGGSVVVNYGATLAPGPLVGPLTINNFLQLDSGSTNIMKLDKAANANDSVMGLSSVSYSGTLIVTNLGGTLAAGDKFYLFISSGGYGGAFEQFNLPPLAPGLSWKTDDLLVDGSISVAGNGTSISEIVLNGSNLEFSGSGGPANGTYYVLTSSNLTLPVSSWTSIQTNLFDSSGNFSFTNGISTSVPQQFYLLQIAP